MIYGSMAALIDETSNCTIPSWRTISRRRQTAGDELWLEVPVTSCWRISRTTGYAFNAPELRQLRQLRLKSLKRKSSRAAEARRRKLVANRSVRHGYLEAAAIGTTFPLSPSR